MNNLLAVPITIREQIYHELLTYDPPAIDDHNDQVAPSSPICNLLTLNRQVHEEVMQFLSSQLCVVVKTNRSRFINKVFSADRSIQRPPLISQLRSRSGAVEKDFSGFPVAMEFDFCVLQSQLEAESAPCFLMPATSFPTLIQNRNVRLVWQDPAYLTFTLLETFSYSQEKALKIFMGSWLDHGPFVHRCLGISTNGAIPSSLTEELRAQLQQNCYGAGHYLDKMKSFEEKLNNDNLEREVTQYAMGLKYARMIYDCRFDLIRDAAGSSLGTSTNDTVLTLWTMTCRTAARLIDVHCHLAGTFGPKGLELADASNSVALLRKARKVAEETINFLSGKPVCARKEFVVLDEVQKPIRSDKYLVSFRAHIVCKALGDVDAAIGYLEDAIKYDAEATDKPVEKLNELKAERGSDNKEATSKVARWES